MRSCAGAQPAGGPGLPPHTQHRAAEQLWHPSCHPGCPAPLLLARAAVAALERVLLLLLLLLSSPVPLPPLLPQAPAWLLQWQLTLARSPLAWLPTLQLAAAQTHAGAALVDSTPEVASAEAP